MSSDDASVHKGTVQTMDDLNKRGPEIENRFRQFLIRLLLVPVCGFVMSIAASYALFIFGAAARLELRIFLETWVFPIFLGLFTGWTMNKKTSVPADLFPWVGPAILFIYTWFSFKPFDSTSKRGLFGNDCGGSECLSTAFITMPLLFSIAYSVAALYQRSKIWNRVNISAD